MIPDDYQDDEQGGGDYPAYLNQTQFSRPANGGNLAGSNGGQLQPAGPGHLLAASQPPQPSTPDAGGRAYFAPQAGPGENAGGAFAIAGPGFTYGKPNAGGPSVAPSFQWDDYSGSPRPPRPAAMPSLDSPAPAPLQKQGALDMFMEQHAARQASQGGGQQGGGQQADEAEGGAAEGEGAAEGAEAAGVEGAGAAGAGGAAEGAELAAAFL